MANKSQPHLISSFSSFSKGSSIAVTIIGSLVLTGWVFDIAALKSIFPGFVTMKANTALCFAVSGISLYLMPREDAWAHRTAKGFAITASIIGIITLSEYIFNVGLGIDQLLFSDIPEVTHPTGRMAPMTALNFSILGLALLCLNLKGQNKYIFAQILTLIPVFFTLGTFLGFLYWGKSLDALNLPHMSVALHTSIAFLLLSFGILFARPEYGIMGVVTSGNAGGVMARRLLLPAIYIPVFLVWLRIKGQEMGFYNTEVGILLLAMVSVASLVVLVWWNSRILEKTDIERKQAEEERHLLLEITKAVSEAEDIDSAIKVVLLTVCKETGWVIGEAWLPSSDGSYLKCSPVWHSAVAGLEDFRKASEGFEFRPGVGLPGSAWLSKKPLWIKDVTLDQNFPRLRIAKEAGIKAGVAIPILSGNKVVAILDFFVFEPKEEDERFIDLVSTIANQLGTIFQRKQAEENLKKSESSLAEAQRIAHIGSWELDLVSNSLIWSDEIFRIFEIDPKKFGASYEAFLDAIHPEDRARVNDAYTDSVKTRIPYSIDHRLLFPDGRIKHVHEQCETFYDKEGKPLRSAGTVQDITERKLIEEEEVRKLNLELEQRVVVRTEELTAANKELEAFSYSVSHDLRAPLRHVVGYVELLQKSSASALDETGSRYLKTIGDSARRMGVLIDDLLAFSRTGRSEMDKTAVDLDQLVKEVIHDLHKEMEGHSIAWRIGSLPTVSGDKAMLKLVLVNLISNAVKYTSKKEQPEIEIGYTDGQEGDLVIFVKDNGVGFDMKYADKLFGVFQRLHRYDEFEGTGIGLANVRRIIHRHGGRTWAEGVLNEGATFYFSLPKSRRIDHD